MSRFLTTLLVLALASTSLEGATRKLRLRSLLHDPLKRQADLYVPVEDRGRDILYLALEGISQAQEVLVADGKLMLFDSETSDPEKPLEHLVAVAAVPDNITRAVALIFPAGEGAKPPYKMMVLDDSLNAFPKGETRVFNLTNLELAMKAGEHNVKLPAAKVSSMGPVKKLDHMNRAPTAFYRKSDGEIPWVLFAERPMQFTLDSRQLILIYGMPQLKAPRLRTIIDNDLP